MTLSVTLQARAELHPEPALETVTDLITDIREAAQELFVDVTHLDMDATPGYAPHIVYAWNDSPFLDQMILARSTSLADVERMDTAYWLADTFAALLDREPGEEIMHRVGGLWRITLNPPTI